MKIVFASVKELINSQVVTKAASELSFELSSLSLSDFLQCLLLIRCRRN
jgi:hypothetical protein